MIAHLKRTMHYVRTVYTIQENIQWNDFVKHFCSIECHIVLAFHCGLILFWLSSFLFTRMPQQLVIFLFLLRAKSIKHTRTDKHKTESNAQNHPETWFWSVSRTLHAYWKGNMVESEAALKYLFKCRCRLFDCELSSASLFRHGVCVWLSRRSSCAAECSRPLISWSTGCWQ